MGGGSPNYLLEYRCYDGFGNLEGAKRCAQLLHVLEERVYILVVLTTWLFWGPRSGPDSFQYRFEDE